MKRLSIIIVTYNSEKDIYDCMASIKKYADIPMSELEIIIVDNNSKEVDSMFAKLRKLYGEDIILINNTHNGGYGQGNNVGIRRATAPVILIMNPDVRLICPIFRTAIEAFENDKIHKDDYEDLLQVCYKHEKIHILDNHLYLMHHDFQELKFYYH